MDYHNPLPVLLLVDDWSSKHSSFVLQDQVVILPVKGINVGNIQFKNKMDPFESEDWLLKPTHFKPF